MITVDNISLSFADMGLFDTKEPWLHPDVTVPTYEIVYVTEGEVHIAEGDNEYHLQRGDMLLLDADVNHRGIKQSFGRTTFFWLHYTVSNPAELGFPKLSRPDEALVSAVLRELLHLSLTSRKLAEITLARLLFECTQEKSQGNRRAYEIDEYIRLNSDKVLTVGQVAEHFSLSPDHVSRLLRSQFGFDGKTAIVKRRIHYIKSILMNTEKPIKLVADECGFEDENSFVKFFKYHEKTTPTAFRNRFYQIRMNKK